MHRLTFLFLSLISLGSAMAAEAKTSAAPSSEVRALYREVELHTQTVQSLKTDQELLEERVRLLENKLDQIQKELTQLTKAAGKGELSKSADSSSQLPAAWNQWRQQTDQNIVHLQQSLQALAKAMSNSNEASSELYVVKNGDSLEKIAKKHHTSVQALIDLNQLKSSKICSGQKLKLPASH